MTCRVWMSAFVSFSGFSPTNPSPVETPFAASSADTGSAHSAVAATSNRLAGRTPGIGASGRCWSAGGNGGAAAEQSGYIL